MKEQDSYIELDVKVSADYTDILISELSEIGYDMFLESETGFLTYSAMNAFDKNAFQSVIDKYVNTTQLSFETKVQKKVNWNEEWEQNFEPVFIGSRCLIRADFHKTDKTFPLEIIINPKMSFGTGHHATTRMMVELLLDAELKDKKVMDAGTGTGILAIAATKLGANEVFALDIDDWCIENGKENIRLNKSGNIQLKKGSISEIGFDAGTFDFVLANINRNILLDELDHYAKALKYGGRLIMSGFLKEDAIMLIEAAATRNLVLDTIKTIENWAAILLVKNEV